MATAAKKTARAKFVPAKTPTPPAVTPKPRKQVDQAALMSRSMAGVMQPELDAGEDVKVNIPRGFTLTDDGHVKHHYQAGPGQMMPIVHAKHFYAQANGVRRLDENGKEITEEEQE